MSTLFMISAQDGERHSHNSVNETMNYIVQRLFCYCNIISSGFICSWFFVENKLEKKELNAVQSHRSKKFVRLTEVVTERDMKCSK